MQRILALRVRREGLALEQLHGKPRATLVDSVVEDTDDALVVDASEGVNLGSEACEAHLGRAADGLERHVDSVGAGRAIHDPVASLTETLEERVAPDASGDSRLARRAGQPLHFKNAVPTPARKEAWWRTIPQPLERE
jgi:hypothetical protein